MPATLVTQNPLEYSLNKEESLERERELLTSWGAQQLCQEVFPSLCRITPVEKNSQSCWMPARVGSWHLMFRLCLCWAEEFICHSGALIRTKRIVVRSLWRVGHESLGFEGPCKMKTFLFQRFLKARGSQGQKKTVDQYNWKKRMGRWSRSSPLQLFHSWEESEDLPGSSQGSPVVGGENRNSRNAPWLPGQQDRMLSKRLDANMAGSQEKMPIWNFMVKDVLGWSRTWPQENLTYETNGYTSSCNQKSQKKS